VLFAYVIKSDISQEKGSNLKQKFQQDDYIIMTLFLQCNKQNIEQNFVAKALLKSGKNLAINQGPWKLFKTEGVKIVSPPPP
jgi:hypothetical protein